MAACPLERRTLALATKKSNLLPVKRLPLCVGAAFVLVNTLQMAATEVESNA
jgi:hypothetical protein